MDKGGMSSQISKEHNRYRDTNHKEKVGKND